MATNFDFVPHYSSQVSIKPRINITRFGDGYVQRGTSGINLFPKVWSLQFNNITTAEAQAIEDVLVEAAGGTLLWKLPPAELADPYLKWICPEGWSRTAVGFNCENFTCTFEQVFE